MADIWETLVQSYLTLDQAMFIQDQYAIRMPSWNASHDFLAIDFREMNVWVVEVSTSTSYRKKIAPFVTEYLPRIKAQLYHDNVIKDPDIWKFGFWIFTSQKNMKMATKALCASKIGHWHCTPLEKVSADMLSGNAWNERVEYPYNDI